MKQESKKKEIEACFCSYFNFLTLLENYLEKKNLFHFGALKALTQNCVMRENPTLSSLISSTQTTHTLL